MDRRMGGWIGDGWMAGWTDGWVDGWMDRQASRQAGFSRKPWKTQMAIAP